MSKIWVTSDTHFGHDNIIRYANRPFRNSEEMDEHLVRVWNVRVGEDDLVYHLGDFAMGPRVETQFIIDMLNRLHGAIIFVTGNHDQPSKWGPGLVGLLESFPDLVPRADMLINDIHELEYDGTKFILCHYPMKDWNGKYKGSIHLHGHVHTQYGLKASQRQIAEKRYDVGVDFFGGPVQLTRDLRYLNSPSGWEL